MSNEYQKGDLVRLKSGGPLMTVESIEEDQVYCVWFDEEDKPQGDDFHPDQLTPAEPE